MEQDTGDFVRAALWAYIVIGGAWLLVAGSRGFGLVLPSALAYLFVAMLLIIFYIAVRTPGRELLALLRTAGTGVIFMSLAALLVYPFSSVMALAAGAAMLAVGALVGLRMTDEGMAFLLALWTLSALMMATGYSLGRLHGNTGAWVAGLFALSVPAGLLLPPLRKFQRALLASLVTVAVGVAGAVLGSAFGAALPFALGFLSIGVFLSILLREGRAMAVAFHSVLAALLMSVGFALSAFFGYAPIVVPAFLAFSLFVSIFQPPSRARLLMLLLTPVGICVGAGFLAGGYFHALAGAVGFMLVLAALGDVAIYFASDSRILGMNDAWVMAERDCPRGYRITRELAAAAGVPPPRLAIIAAEAPNLFTVGRRPSRAVIAMTQGLLATVSDEELESLLAHEIAHIRGRDLMPMTLAAAIASVVGGPAKSLIFEKDRGFYTLTLVLVGIFAPFFALLVQLSVPRSREMLADAMAVTMTRKNETLARALEKLEAGAGAAPLVVNPATAPLFAVNPFRGGWLAALFATHPSTEERVSLIRKSGPSPAGG